MHTAPAINQQSAQSAVPLGLPNVQVQVVVTLSAVLSLLEFGPESAQILQSYNPD